MKFPVFFLPILSLNITLSLDLKNNWSGFSVIIISISFGADCSTFKAEGETYGPDGLNEYGNPSLPTPCWQECGNALKNIRLEHFCSTSCPGLSIFYLFDYYIDNLGRGCFITKAFLTHKTFPIKAALNYHHKLSMGKICPQKCFRVISC